MGLFQIHHRFNNDQVYAARGQRFNLFPEGCPGLFERGWAKRLQAQAERPDRAGYIEVFPRAFACQPRPSQVDFTHLIG